MLEKVLYFIAYLWHVCRNNSISPVEIGAFSSKEQCGGFTLLWTKPLSEVLTRWTGVQSPGAALNYQVKDITEPTRCSHSSCSSHRRPVTFVLLIVLHFFKGLAGTIGHLEAFMSSKKQTLCSISWFENWFEDWFEKEKKKHPLVNNSKQLE